MGFIEEAVSGDSNLASVMLATQDEAYSPMVNITNPRAAMQEWIRQLLTLRGIQNTKNRDRLVMFMTGSGVAGKITVIDNVMAYAKKFCRGIGIPFAKRTIL